MWQASSKGGVADVARRGGGGKVAAVVHLIGGEEQVFAGAGAEDGAVVADAGEDAVASGEAATGEAVFDPGDEFGFFHRLIVSWKDDAIGSGIDLRAGNGVGTGAGGTARGGGQV